MTSNIWNREKNLLGECQKEHVNIEEQLNTYNTHKELW